MKILIINDLLIYGGAEMQGRREKEILEKNGHEVYLLTFDEKFPVNHELYNCENKFINIKIKNKGLIAIYRKIFKDYQLINKIKQVIEKIEPNIIHINNLYLAPFSQYNALEQYKCVQTIRDYSAVCPLGTCIYNNYKICKGIKFNKCNISCNFSLKSKLKLYRYKQVDKLRKSVVNKFICPSEMLTEYCEQHDFNIQCINNSFDSNKIKRFNKKVDLNKKKYLYFGVINENKGVFKLLEAFEEFSKDKNVELLLAGKVEDEFKDKFNSYLKNNKRLRYLGYQDYEKMLSVLEEVYSVVIPSLWMENYPNTVLEGMVTECLVLGSNRGGIPGMLSYDRGVLFDVMNKDDIIDKLNISYNLSKEKYLDIVNRAKEYVISNNNTEKYYERLIKVFNKVLIDQ
ncbi:glycosyltransferase [Clostridium sp. BSD9I1]|uniref:glycosyltransferase n=1 Tax=Clostridium sp. BSD9I1 TaxID=2003589 RepID=UPI001645A8E2|nr:glycosyltransferase [Clostridium sp. BSD9I1]